MGVLRHLHVVVADGLEKARGLARRQTETELVPSVGRRSAFADASYLQTAVRYRDKPWGLSYDLLRTLSLRDSVLAAIITTRIRQVTSFTRVARLSTDGRGHGIRHRDVKHQLTQVERKLVESNEMFIQRCGSSDPIDKRTGAKRDSFPVFCKKIVRDRLTYDQLCGELVPNRRRELTEFHAVDAATMRIRYNTDVRMPDGYVQLLDGRPWEEWDIDEFMFCVDNPRTDIRVGGYGLGEIEKIINIITAHLFAEEVNKRRVQPGVQVDGLLWSEGSELTPEMLESLRRAWQAQAQGVIGTGHIAAINLPQGSKLNYIPIHKGVSDMEWSKWIDYMINIACAVYAIDPAEINFPNRGGPAQGTPMFETGHEARLMYSKDKGLHPLLRFLEDIVTEHILWKLEGGEDFVFEFKGVDARTREQEADVAAKETSTFLTINEYRAAHDMPPVEGGDIIRDPAFMQAQQNAQMQAQQEQLAQQQAAQQQGAPPGLPAPGETAGAEGEAGAAEGGGDPVADLMEMLG